MTPNLNGYVHYIGNGSSSLTDWRQINLDGLVLQTIFQTRSILEVFTKGVSFLCRPTMQIVTATDNTTLGATRGFSPLPLMK